MSKTLCLIHKEAYTIGLVVPRYVISTAEWSFAYASKGEFHSLRPSLCHWCIFVYIIGKVLWLQVKQEQSNFIKCANVITKF